MSKNSDRPNLRQGEGGGARTRASGSKFKQSKTGGARKGPGSGSKFTQSPTGGAKPRGKSGSHLDPQPGLTYGKRSAERGGHSRTGYGSGASPTAGKAKSGSKFTQHPSLRK